MTSVRGMISFAVGGAILLWAIYDIVATVSPTYYGYNSGQMTLQTLLLGFVSFLLIGLGLVLIMQDARTEKKLPVEK